MTSRPTRWLLAAALALLPSAAPAQFRQEPLRPQQPAPLRPDGYDLFVGLLVVNGLKPLTQTELRSQPLRDVVAVFLGSPTDFRTDSRLWADWTAQRGGAVLIASDTYLDLGAWSERARDPFGRRNNVVTGWRGQATERAQGYNGRSTCPFVVPLEPPAAAGPEWELFRGLDRVATNDPSCLHIPLPHGEFQSPLAGFPRSTQFTGGFPNVVRSRLNPEEYPLAVGAADNHPDTTAPYRYLVLSDPSVFINEMLLPVNAPANDNLEFARRVVAFLKARGDGTDRTRFVLYLNGYPVEDFTLVGEYLRPPQPPLPEPPPLRKLLLQNQGKIVDMMNQLMERRQQSEAVSTPFKQDRAFRDMVAALLVIASVWAVWFVLRRVWGTRQPGDAPAPLPVGRAAAAAAPGGVFDRRERELLRRNNLYEPVRDAAREMFEAAGTPPDPGPRLPRVVIEDVVRRPGTLRKALADLWKIAYGPPRAVTVHQWEVLEPLLIRARRAFADGKWRFAGTGGPDA